MSTSSRTGRRLWLGALVLSALLVLGACGSSTDSGSGTATTSPATTATGMTLVGPWVLASYAGPDGPVPASPGATMAFAADGTFSGNTGCNVLNGTYTTSGSSMTVTPGPMTMRACADPAIDAQEQALVTGLPTVTGFAIAGDQLTLSDSSGAPLFVFTAGPTGLEGTSWKVTGVNNGRGAVEGTSLTEALTLEFGGGTVSGFNGCNTFSGSFTTTGTTITISTDLATTLIACEPDVDALAQQYTTALTASTTYEVSGSMLTLRDAEGAMQVTATSA
jgi:heat shock protein HslJ